MFILFETDTKTRDLDHVLATVRDVDGGARLFMPAEGPMIFVPASDRAQVSPLVANVTGLRAIYDADKLPLVSRAIFSDDAHVDIGGVRIGDHGLAVVAGPCSVDDPNATVALAKDLATLGATHLRGGAYKPRTSPYAFEGHEVEGLKMLQSARHSSGLGVITEALDAEGAAQVAKYADAIQIGARTMQAFALLHAVGALRKPVVLKRGFGCTVDETLHAAEHLLAHGAPGVVFVERGIRTFENTARFTLDLSGAIRLKQRSRFPVIVDPSHAAGDVSLITPLARAAVAAGLDGVMVEVHHHPEVALSDKDQALTVDGFASLLDSLRPIAAAMGREMRAPSTHVTAVEHAA